MVGATTEQRWVSTHELLFEMFVAGGNCGLSSAGVADVCSAAQGNGLALCQLVFHWYDHSLRVKGVDERLENLLAERTQQIRSDSDSFGAPHFRADVFFSQAV